MKTFLFVLFTCCAAALANATTPTSRVTAEASGQGSVGVVDGNVSIQNGLTLKDIDPVQARRISQIVAMRLRAISLMTMAGLLLTGLFMVAVDQRVLLVALPTLTGTFGTDPHNRPVDSAYLRSHSHRSGHNGGTGRRSFWSQADLYDRLSTFHLRLSPLRSVSLPHAAYSV